MADVSKIRLPDNNTVNIKDYRIPGVDTTPTSGSSNLITSGGVYQDIEDTSRVVSAALNDLNDRVVDIEDEWVTTEEFSQLEGVVRDTYTKQEIDTMLAEIESGGSENVVTKVKIGTTDYNPSNGTVSLPAYPTTLPASDVSSWAKASTKPSYTANEVGAQEVLVSGTNIKTVNNQSLLGSGNISVEGAKVYAFNYTSWWSDIVDGHLNIPLATYGEMIEDVQNGVPVILRLQHYETSGGVVTSGQCDDFYLYRHTDGGNISWLNFWQTFSTSGTFYREITLSSSGSTVSIFYFDLNHEFKNNRVNSITGSGSTEQYPTTRAVVNYVAANGGLPAVSTWGRFLVSDWDSTSSSYKWRVSPDLYFNSATALQIDASGGVLSPLFNTKSGPQGNAWIQIDSRGLVGEASNNQSVYSDWSWIKYRSSYSPSAYVTLQNTLDSIGLPPVTSADYGKMLFVDYDSTKGYHWNKNAPFHIGSNVMFGDPYWGIRLKNSTDEALALSHEGVYYIMDSYRTAASKNWNWIAYDYYDSTANTRFNIGLQDTLDTKQNLLVSGTNIKTINNQSLLGSGNITISGGGGDTSTCVHKTGDESVGGDKTFTDNIAVVDASHILYSGASPSQGFTRGYATNDQGDALQTMTFTGLLGEPKAFIIAYGVVGNMDSNGVNFVVGDSTGLHGVYNTGTQHNYSASFTKSYSNGTLTITAPSGVVFGDYAYSLVYYYGDGTLTFKTSQVQPGSGITALTFTGNGLTEVPAMYAVMLETQVNDEQYRRVAGYTNCAFIDGNVAPTGITFLTGGPVDTTSSFSASYNNGLYINSGGMNAGGYFHNPGTYTLYYLMASDIGGGGSGSYNSLKDELDDIRNSISGIETLLAAI